jgi:hypothetical protein
LIAPAPKGGGFIPLATYYAKNPKIIPASVISFDSAMIGRLATHENLQELRINDAAEGFLFEPDDMVGDARPAMSLRVIAEGAFTGYYCRLSYYGNPGGRLQSYFASTAPVLNWRFVDGGNCLLIHYSSGVGGYAFRDLHYVRDDSVQKSHRSEVARLATTTWFAKFFISERTVGWMLLALIAAVIRGLKTLWLDLSKQAPKPRGQGTQTFLITIFTFNLMLIAFYFVMANAEQNYLGNFMIPAILASAGWAAVTAAAFASAPRPAPEPAP